MRIVGHTQQREILRQSRSPVVLLQGPSGVGKWLIARSHADEQGGATVTLRDGPTVEQARDLVEFYRQKPLAGGSAVALIDLDECSEAVQNVLLKVLEELPEWGRCYLVASSPPMATIRSRAQSVWFFPLPEGEVVEALRGLGFPASDSEKMAMVAGGSVEQALKYREAIKHKSTVLSYIGLLIRHDNAGMLAQLPRWTDDATMMLWRWINEVLTDWPKVYSKEDLGLVHQLGVRRFYALVEALQSGYSVDVAALRVWKVK